MPWKVPPIIPGWVDPGSDPSGQISPDDANRLASDQRSVQKLASSQDAVLPILYGGPERMAGKLYCAKVAPNSFLYMGIIFCEGEVDGLSDTLRGAADGATDPAGLEINDVPVKDARVYVHLYRGTQTQNVDSWLSQYITGYSENLRGTAYLVAEVWSKQYGGPSGVPVITARVMGRKVYDPRSNLVPGSNWFGHSGNGWAFNGTLATNKNVTGPFGASNYAYTLTDSDAGGYANVSCSITVANDSAKYFISAKLKKQAGMPTPSIDISLTGGTLRKAVLRVKPADGSYDSTGSTAISDVSVTEFVTGWYQVEFAITNNASGNTTLLYVVNPASCASGTFTDAVATQGANVFCELQVRRSDKPRGYLDTYQTALDQPTQWSDNPALCLGDYLASTSYGEGRTVDADSLAEAAAFCDEVLEAYVSGNATYTWANDVVTVTASAHGFTGKQKININFTSGGGTPSGIYDCFYSNADTFFFQLSGSGASGNLTYTAATVNERRARVTLPLDGVQPVRTWRELLRSYVPCWVNIDGDKAYLKVDKAGTTDHVFTTANIDGGDPPVFRRSGVMDAPNSVTIGWTDTRAKPWRTQVAIAELAGITTKRKTRINLPGVRSYSHARRIAIERLNHYTIEDVSGEVTVYEEGLKVWPGDIIEITDTAYGIAAGKKFRVLGVTDKGHGRWRLRFREYQANAYSGLVESAPEYGDAAMASIDSIPALSAIASADEWRWEGGTWNPRIAVSWANPGDAYPWVSHFEVEVLEPAYSASTYTVSGDTITVSCPGGIPGLAVNDQLYIDFTSGSLSGLGELFSVTGYTGSPATQFTVFRRDVAGAGGNCEVRKLREMIPSPTNVAVTSPVELNTTYTVKVRIASAYGTLGPRSSDTHYIAASSSYGGTTQTPVFMGTSPPAVAAQGTLWFNTEFGGLFVYYVDADGGQWVRI
jgi:hypothetical protein